MPLHCPNETDSDGTRKSQCRPSSQVQETLTRSSHDNEGDEEESDAKGFNDIVAFRVSLGFRFPKLSVDSSVFGGFLSTGFGHRA